MKKFVKFTNDNFSAETPFRVRSKDSETFSAIFNQFGQLLREEDRRPVEPLPEEMEIEDAKPSPAPTP